MDGGRSSGAQSSASREPPRTCLIAGHSWPWTAQVTPKWRGEPYKFAVGEVVERLGGAEISIEDTKNLIAETPGVVILDAAPIEMGAASVIPTIKPPQARQKRRFGLFN